MYSWKLTRWWILLNKHIFSFLKTQRLCNVRVTNVKRLKITSNNKPFFVFCFYKTDYLIFILSILYYILLRVKTSYCVFLPGFRNGALMPTMSLFVRLAKFTRISLIPIISATHSSYPLSCRPFCNLDKYKHTHNLIRLFVQTRSNKSRGKRACYPVQYKAAIPNLGPWPKLGSQRFYGQVTIVIFIHYFKMIFLSSIFNKIIHVQ